MHYILGRQSVSLENRCTGCATRDRTHPSFAFEHGRRFRLRKVRNPIAEPGTKLAFVTSGALAIAMLREFFSQITDFYSTVPAMLSVREEAHYFVSADVLDVWRLIVACGIAGATEILTLCVLPAQFSYTESFA
jgi:hypothetical protein